ncbi:MAG: hypothetical protein MUF08_11950 [Burkholderiaceae bacterium]|jgi:hypothetical protein|nr:hypothetical protein [Burkholderiaceae bacterium]MCU0965735.1 hypothetical protein [Burkholderiaceae bacterium]
MAPCDRPSAEGDPRHLLELLLRPTNVDNHNVPLPGSFVDLPDDGELRLAIVRVLLFGPWKGATTVQELMTKTGWGKGKPSLSDFEVSVLGLFAQTGVDLHDLAEGAGVEAETLRKRIAKQRKT